MTTSVLLLFTKLWNNSMISLSLFSTIKGLLYPLGMNVVFPCRDILFTLLSTKAEFVVPDRGIKSTNLCHSRLYPTVRDKEFDLCFICHHSDLSVSVDAGTEHGVLIVSALTFRSCNHSAISTVVHNAFLATFAFRYFYSYLVKLPTNTYMQFSSLTGGYCWYIYFNICFFNSLWSLKYTMKENTSLHGGKISKRRVSQIISLWLCVGQAKVGTQFFAANRK
jgi:hypothetical protein